jgi:ABC-type Fe3+/spermidine/putrescine transport system ATPase subunit
MAGEIRGSSVRFEGVAKRFGPVAALQPIDLAVAAGEFFTLLGPSGSGKTTLLNITAGYVAPSAGRVRVDDRDATFLAPRKRHMGMVFQNFALFPHLTVFENVAYGLRARRMPEAEVRRRTEEALGMVQLSGLGGRRIGEISGGQQQRVALARALVIEPAVLLMDEPLGALDRQLRKEVQLELRRMHQRWRRTTIYVTHDQEEALVMSDRIGILRAGRLEQVGTPRELYDAPASAFVAGFLGHSNLLAGTVRVADPDRVELEVPGLPAPIQGVPVAGLRAGDPATALVRPEHVRLGGGPGTHVEGRVEEVVYLGDLIAIRLALPGGRTFWWRRFAHEGAPSEEAVKVGWDAARVRILPE